MDGSTPLFACLCSVCTALTVWLGYAMALGSVAAALTWTLIRLLGRHARPPLEMALWTVVLLKFLIPAGPDWSLSLESLCSRLARQSPVETGIEQIPSFAALSIASTIGQGKMNASGASGGWHQWSWTLLAAPVYVACLLILTRRRLRTYLAFRARCLALSVADGRAESLVHRVCRRLGVRSLPRVRVTGEQCAPLVMGLLHPVLVLPRHQLSRPDELETVIVHEVTHLRRGDLFVRMLQCVAGTLLFFWPVIAWINRRIDQAREQTCDEWALRHGKLTPGQYARCLLLAVQQARPRVWAYSPACMAGRANMIERRIDVILSLRNCAKPRPMFGLLAVGLVLGWAAFTLAGPRTAKSGNPQYQNTEEDMRAHADVLFAHVNEFAAGDINGDGKVTKDECWAFITAVVMQQPAAVLAAYPAADGNQDGVLDLAEAYGFVRGDPDLQATQKRLSETMESAKKSGDEQQMAQAKAEWVAAEMATYHVILDRRESLLQLMTKEPDLATVQQIAQKMAQRDSEMAAKDLVHKMDEVTHEIQDLRTKAGELRTAAASFTGQEATGRLQKAEKLEQKASEMETKLTTVLTERIAKLEQAGDTAGAEALRAKLAKLSGL